MCGGPKVVQQDPEADAKKAADKAAAEANAAKAARRGANASSVLASGINNNKTTLGGG